MKKNVVLTGMMGVGKSTIGKKLANRLKLKFVDIDHMIESLEKNAINEIFKNKGEHYFRKIEKKITLDVLKKNNLVIALGGGAFINSDIREVALSSSETFWLDLSTKNILKRLNNTKKRPLLNEKHLEKSINKIYSERKKIYNKSKHRIKCDLLEIEQIIEQIVKIYEN